MSILLFVVETHRQVGNGLALLPGVPTELLSLPEVMRVQQGTPIELRPPDGHNLDTVIENYCIQAPVELIDPEELKRLPIQIIVPRDITEEKAPPGTEVWLK